MKKLRLSILACAVAGAAMLVGCDSPEKMKDMPQEAFPKMSPNPLVLKGKTVEGKITGVFPPKYFHKKAVLELVPVLMYDGGELVLPSKTYQGEDVTENNPVINHDAGGQYNHPISFDYKDEMFSSNMELRFNLYYKGERIPFDETYKLGIGVDATQLLVDVDTKPVMLPANYQRDRSDSKEAQIMFPIQRPDIPRAELTREDVKAFQEAIKSLSADEKTKLKGVSIRAYASPDGPSTLNENLSKGRGRNTENWVASALRRSKVDPKMVSVDETTTDWDGFKSMVEASNIEDKDMILRVLSMYSDPEVRNREMHNLGKVFQTLAEDILPKLRRAKMIAMYDIEGRTDEELRAMVDEDKIKEMSLNEALHAATLYQDLGVCEKIYKTLAEDNNDIRVYNNLAGVYILEGQNDLAGEQLQKAGEIDAENPAVLNNMGVLAARNGNMEEARRMFGQAMDAGKTVKENLGICAIMEGDYSSAVDYLSGAGTFNEGLALLLADRNEAAKNVFAEVKNAKAHYGLAIVGARSGDEKMVIDHLRTAIQMNNGLKDRASKDVVFVKFRQNEMFASLLK